MARQNSYLCTEVSSAVVAATVRTDVVTGHTARPTDFCWAPGEKENWHITSASEDNVVMVWQPTMRIWAGDDFKVDEKELEGDAMEGVEATGSGEGKAKSSRSSGVQSASRSVSGASGMDD